MDQFIIFLTNIFTLEPKPLSWQIGDTIFYTTEVAVYPIAITKMSILNYFDGMEHSIFQTKHNATRLLNKRQEARAMGEVFIK